MRGNLFVVSRVGQLRNVQSFIKEFGATHNHLAVLSGESDLVLSENIEANIEKDLFEEILRIRQPPAPLTQTRKTNGIIYKQIEDLLVTMATEREVDKLFLCNSDNYYSLFEKVARDRKLTLAFNLLEEGLGTYASAGKKNYVQDTSVDWSEVKRRGRHFRRAAVRTVRSFVTMLATLISLILRIDTVKLAKDAWANLFVSEKHRYGTITHFDDAYVYFPDKIYSHNMQVDHVHKLDFVLEPSAPPHLFDKIEDGAVVFVSQKYLSAEASYAYFSIVFEIFAEMGLEKVFFKFHPKENRGSFERAWRLALKEHPHPRILNPKEIQAIPVEELMMAGKVKQVIGLTSTSLMYGKAFFPGVDVVSIGERFKQLAESSEYDISKRALAQFSRDLEVFIDVSDVRQF